jgi:hypothetical protein
MEIQDKTSAGFRRIGGVWFRLLVFAIIVPFLFWSCERDIEIKLKQQEPKLVVEATIENGEPPMVILTSSLNYFSKISPELLAQSFVRGADVFISNGSKTHQLKEYAVPLGSGYNFFYYSIDSANLSTAFVGELNKTYSLRIATGGKEYTASTTIPGITKIIDSIWWKKAPAQTDTSKIVVMVRATDPPGFGDYIRYFTKRNHEPFLPPTNSAFDDLFVDGTTYELPVDPGVDRNNPPDDDEKFFRRGDTLQFKLSNIDKVTFDFWRTMEFSYQSVGNPFSTPVKVLGNISGNALGYFGGYASQYRTLIIPK